MVMSLLGQCEVSRVGVVVIILGLVQRESQHNTSLYRDVADTPPPPGGLKGVDLL